MAPDETPRSVASHLGLNCLPMRQYSGLMFKYEILSYVQVFHNSFIGSDFSHNYLHTHSYMCPQCDNGDSHQQFYCIVCLNDHHV